MGWVLLLVVVGVLVQATEARTVLLSSVCPVPGINTPCTTSLPDALKDQSIGTILVSGDVDIADGSAPQPIVVSRDLLITAAPPPARARSSSSSSSNSGGGGDDAAASAAIDWNFAKSDVVLGPNVTLTLANMTSKNMRCANVHVFVASSGGNGWGE